MSVDYGEKKKPLRECVRELLWDLKWHTHIELGRVGGARYNARVHEMKREGYVIESEDIADEGGGKRYRLVSRTPGAPQEKRVKAFLTEDDAHLATMGEVTETAQVAIKDALESFRANRAKL